MFWRLFLLKLHAVCRKTAIFAYKMSNQYKKQPMEKIDNLDKKILEIITGNARIPFKDVAAECGVSRAAIHQRVQRLIDLGVIVGSGYHVDPKLQHLYLRGCHSRTRFDVQTRSRGTEPHSGSRGMPFHHRTLHYAHQAVCLRQCPSDGTVEQQAARNSGSNLHRNLNFTGTEHQ